MGIFRFLGLGLGLVTVAGFAGCSSDEHATRGLASGCTINTDCAAPLVCAFQRCHQQCTSTRDCSGGLTCVTSNGAGVCQFEDESTCARDADCGSGQVCAGGACRAGCRDSSACLASQDCVDGVCEDVAVDGGGGSGGSSGGSGGSAGASGAGGEAADASTDAGPPPECHLATLATDCPSNECRQATTCSLDGKCVYSPLAPATCGTCDLGKPSCADPSAPACGDIEVLGLAGAEVNCDSTSPDATFVFVDPTYTGPSPSGSRTAPFVDLAAALTAASRPGRGATTVVIAGSPVYTSTLVVPDGVSIRGGYSATDDTGAFTGVWRRDLSRRPIWNIGPASLGDHVLVGLRAEHVHRTSIVADVTVVTQAIGGASADAGASNVGVLALDAPGLRLFEVTVVAGAAQDGAVGADGPVVASVGVAGVNGKANLASGAPPVAAGQPGTHNSACDIPQTQGGNSGNINGASAPGSPAPGGAAGASTVAEAGADGAPQTGVGATGNGGASTSAVDAVTGVLTLTGTGDTGSQGPHGYGGGGGYSSVNGIGSNLYYYAVGGSGGAGGCGGLGGLGGLPGGWSIGILAVSSTGLEIRNGSVTSGNGGNGGAGGPGAAGSAGGRGGSGAIIQNAPNPPSIQSSAGGKGSDGGAGGPGGVGAGGSSVAVYCSASGTIAPAGTTLKTGKVGTGGSGKKAVTTLGCG